MNAVGTMHSEVKNSRYGIRRPPRSVRAPRIGETRALSPTLTTTATLRMKLPSRSPNRPSATSHRPIAQDTTANEKIVFAKSYSAHATATRARPRCQPAEPREQPHARSLPRRRISDAHRPRARP